MFLQNCKFCVHPTFFFTHTLYPVLCIDWMFVPNMVVFTLYQIAKRSVAKSVPDRASVHTRNAAFKQFLLWNRGAPLRCWKWNVSYRIGFWNCPSQVWTLLLEQKLQRNLVLANDLFKSKGSVADCMSDRASVHTGNASEQFLHHNITLILVHSVLAQLLKRSKNLSGTVWTYP